MRTVNGSIEPEMSLTHSCGAVIKYYLSDVMNTDSKKLSCKNCKKEIQLNFPNYMMVQIENGKPIMRIDLGLVLTETALNDPNELLSAWVSYMNHLNYPMTKSKEKCVEKLPEEYKQDWWSCSYDI